MLDHLELCWLWLDYMFVVDTSSVLFGIVGIQLISILFSLCGICSIDLFDSTSSPLYMFKPMDWNMKCDFCWFILFPPFMLYFFFIVSTISGPHHLHHSNQLQLTLHPFPDQSTNAPTFSSFLFTFPCACNLGRAWPPCPRQPRHTHSYSLARRRVHTCLKANTL